MRFIPLDDRRFVLVVEYPPKFEKVATPLVESYFDSLEILGDTPSAASNRK